MPTTAIRQASSPIRGRDTTWVRGPWWDSFWFLSGVPIGLALVLLADKRLWITLILLFQLPHLISPFALSWSHAGYRAHMLQHKTRFIAVPLAIVAASAGIGAAFSAGLHISPYATSFTPDVEHLDNHLEQLFLLYSVLNLWHFGKQNFGILSIYRRKYGSGHRQIDLWFSLGAQIAVVALAIGSFELDRDTMQIITTTAALAGAAVMLSFETRLSARVPLILAQAVGILAVPISPLLGLGIWQANHWLTALGISSHAWANYRRQSSVWFVLAMIAGGLVLYWLLFSRDPTLALHMTGWAIGLRLGLGLVHFLYDRWLYKFSDPAVRATIGKEIMV